jgi:O-acetyl-ADP-ribose deacetylase (regulator of RNase III)/uncharacterized protein YwgA
MIKVLIGDLFQSQAQTLVNTVNCVGVMGKGVALAFKERFPDMFEDYVTRCQRGDVKLGCPYLFRRLLLPWILNFPTKDYWRAITNLKDIRAGLEYLLRHYREWGIESLAVPPLGCGAGQLEWRIVGPTLHRYLSRMDVPIELYAPYGTPHDELQPEFLEGRDPSTQPQQAMPSPEHVKPAWVALVEILKRIEEQPYHWPVGRTTFQKIAYVATEEGLPTELNYQRGSFGPFAPGLKSVESRLLNNDLIQEEQLGRMFAIKVGPTYRDARIAYTSYLEKWDLAIEKVTDLFMRMDTQHAEVAATVLYAARNLLNSRNTQPTEKEVFDAVMDWKVRRRPPLESQEVALTIRNLAMLSWLDLRASQDLPLSGEEILLDA